ncbi:alpha/beta hydrolase [Homoserinimonas sp. A520]
MDEELEEFNEHADEKSLAPETEYEGSNSSRFAIAGTLGSDSESLPKAWVIPRENLERFGFNADLALPDRTESIGDELRYLSQVFREPGSVYSLRRRAWEDLNEQAELSARLAFLASGLVSPLERESVTAAVAILNSTSIHRNAPLPFGVRTSRWMVSPWFLGFGVPWMWDWVGTLPTEVQEDENESLLWEGSHWSQYSQFWLEEASFRGEGELLAIVALMARWRVEAGRRSPDAVTRELAAAALFTPPTDNNGEPDRSEPPARAKGTISTIIHGTIGWKKAWWYRNGDFHDFIKSQHRPGLYSGGLAFGWSGSLSDTQRRIAGDRFRDWADEVGGPNGLKTVFAHSYGAEIAARAANTGARIEEVVFLSAPIHHHHSAMLDRVHRVIDIRLRNDIVLTLASIYKGARHRLPQHDRLTVEIIDRSLWKHSETRNPVLWKQEDLANRVAL